MERKCRTDCSRVGEEKKSDGSSGGENNRIYHIVVTDRPERMARGLSPFPARVCTWAVL